MKKSWKAKCLQELEKKTIENEILKRSWGSWRLRWAKIFEDFHDKSPISWRFFNRILHKKRSTKRIKILLMINIIRLFWHFWKKTSNDDEFLRMKFSGFHPDSNENEKLKLFLQQKVELLNTHIDAFYQRHKKNHGPKNFIFGDHVNVPFFSDKFVKTFEFFFVKPVTKIIPWSSWKKSRLRYHLPCLFLNCAKRTWNDENIELINRCSSWKLFFSKQFLRRENLRTV